MDPERRQRIMRNFEQLVGKAGSDDQAFRSALGFLREHMVLPSYATFAGLPVTVANIEYHGSPRLGITAVVLRRNRRYRVCLLDLEFSPELAISDWQEAYRSWVGWPTAAAHEDRRWSRGQFGIDDARILRDRGQRSDEAIAQGDAEGALVGAGLAGLSDGRTTAELVVFSVGNRIAACRCLDSGQDASVHLSSRETMELIPGEILKLEIDRIWNYRKQLHVSGQLMEHGFDIPRLGLTALRLTDQGQWDPEKFFEEELSGRGEQELAVFYVPILAAGKRPEFDMEQVVPGNLDPYADGPILEAVYAEDMGKRSRAKKILMNLLREDLRCLDAYAHLGNLYIDRQTDKALRLYRVALNIAALSFPPGFNGVLPWGHLDNRPYLRCLHGCGLCLWRLGYFGEAEEMFERMLWLNPVDNQGARFLIAEVREKRPWRPDL